MLDVTEDPTPQEVEEETEEQYQVVSNHRRTLTCASFVFSMKGLIWILGITVAGLITWWYVHDEFPVVGSTPIYPTFCASFNTNNQPYYIPLIVNGTMLRVLPDTGSSNLVIASSSCKTCEISPKMSRRSPWPKPSTNGSYRIAYGTGSIVVNDARARIKVGSGMEMFGASLGAIVKQNTSFGFNLFPQRPKGGIIPLTPNRQADTCYNTYAGGDGACVPGQGARADPRARTLRRRRTARKRKLSISSLLFLGCQMLLRSNCAPFILGTVHIRDDETTNRGGPKRSARKPPWAIYFGGDTARSGSLVIWSLSIWRTRYIMTCSCSACACAAWVAVKW